MQNMSDTGNSLGSKSESRCHTPVLPETTTVTATTRLQQVENAPAPASVPVPVPVPDNSKVKDGDEDDDDISSTTSFTSDEDSSSDSDSDDSDSDSDGRHNEDAPPARARDDSKIADGLVVNNAVFDDEACAYLPRVGAKIDREGVRMLNALRKTGGLHEDDKTQKRADRGYLLKTPGGTRVKLVVDIDTDTDVHRILLFAAAPPPAPAPTASPVVWTKTCLSDIKELHDCYYTAGWLAVLLNIQPNVFASVPDLAAAVTTVFAAGSAVRDVVRANIVDSRKAKALGPAPVPMPVLAAPAPAPATLQVNDKKRKRDNSAPAHAVPLAVVPLAVHATTVDKTKRDRKREAKAMVAPPAPAPPAPELIPILPTTAAMETKITKLRLKLTAALTELATTRKQLETCHRSLELKKKSCNMYAALVETLQESQRADLDTDNCRGVREDNTNDAAYKKRKSSKKSTKKHSSHRRHHEHQQHSMTSTTL